MKEFDLEKAKMGYPLCTRDGSDARIIYYDRKGDYPILAFITEKDNTERSIDYTQNGSYSHGVENHPLDLMLKDDGFDSPLLKSSIEMLGSFNATPKEEEISEEPTKGISEEPTIGIPKSLYDKLCYLGIIDASGVRGHNEGNSDYNSGKHLISPWVIWLDYPELTSWDDDIIKRVLREKKDAGYTKTQQRILDYKKIKHDCDERIRQLEFSETKPK